jgi:hypothetical protein
MEDYGQNVSCRPMVGIEPLEEAYGVPKASLVPRSACWRITPQAGHETRLGIQKP